jgi:3-methylcrotonyl-CoA carboxylase alpha subunit
VEYRAKDYRMAIGPVQFSVTGKAGENGSIDAVIDGQQVHAAVIPWRGRFHVFYADQSCVLTYVDPLEISAQGHSSESNLLAPMPGRVIAQLVQPGDRVEEGNPLLVLEAMKMEYTIHAPDAGRVESFHFAVGDQVTEGAELLHFNRENPPGEES